MNVIEGNLFKFWGYNFFLFSKKMYKSNEKINVNVFVIELRIEGIFNDLIRIYVFMCIYV